MSIPKLTEKNLDEILRMGLIAYYDRLHISTAAEKIADNEILKMHEKNRETLLKESSLFI